MNAASAEDDPEAFSTASLACAQAIIDRKDKAEERGEEEDEEEEEQEEELAFSTKVGALHCLSARKSTASKAQPTTSTIVAPRRSSASSELRYANRYRESHRLCHDGVEAF